MRHLQRRRATARPYRPRRRHRPPTWSRRRPSARSRGRRRQTKSLTMLYHSAELEVEVEPLQGRQRLLCIAVTRVRHPATRNHADRYTLSVFTARLQACSIHTTRLYGPSSRPVFKGAQSTLPVFTGRVVWTEHTREDGRCSRVVWTEHP